MLGEGPWPSIGSVDTLELPGPHGTLTVRRHTPARPASDPIGALVYIHGGGFTYGTLDEFETAMRIIAERARAAHNWRWRSAVPRGRVPRRHAIGQREPHRPVPGD